ncbi:hypothetical protein BJY01DRAFT_217256 [Aspergillus pseudoustus]|uniref:Exonuclease domain-containing protein n=1 Tax=Aspergillus pseudoustus TaxID=1810923 RepID=A0ABR4JNU0_9EURO
MSKRTYHNARLGNDLVFSTTKARLRLFEDIDRNPIIVGHALLNDFKALEMRPYRVVDTQILEKDGADRALWPHRPLRGIPKLRDLAEQMCDEIIQANPVKGHDCVEDVYATREVLLEMELSPVKLVSWAQRHAHRQRMG